MSVVLILGLVVLMLYLLPLRVSARGRYSYAPSGAVGLLIVALVVMIALGVLPWDFGGYFDAP